MAKAKKVYTIIGTKDRDGRQYKQVGTVEELVQAYSYTLECGESWQHEKGNAKINRNPKNIEALVKNIYNAENNRAANGYMGISYRWVEGDAVAAEALAKAEAAAKEAVAKITENDYFNCVE